ncbi:MAG: hypothetical protein ACRC30_01340 [Clostridium sp.]
MIDEKWRVPLMNVTWRDIEIYSNLVKELKESDVTKNSDFQKNYNYFYKVRQKKKEFYESYYEIMEREKSKEVTFEKIIKELYKRNGTIEASFASKLLSTIDANYPIWDTYVLKSLGFKAPTNNDKEIRLVKVIEVYKELCKWYDEFRKTDECKAVLKKFDELYPSTISDVKKIDFLLWNMR